MLGQLFHPGVRDEDGVFIVVVIWKLEPLLMSFLNDLTEVMCLESTKHAKEESSKRGNTEKDQDQPWRPRKGS